MIRQQKEKINQKGSLNNCLHIDELGWHGDGIANVNGKRIYIPYALAGEKVSAFVTGSQARLHEILRESPDRVEPQCKYHGKCGGCAVQHLNYQIYFQWKRQVIVNALTNRRIEAPVEKMIDGHGTGRRRVALHVHKVAGQTRVGFMQVRSNNLVRISRCPILTPELAKATNIARDLSEYLLGSVKSLNIQLTASETGLDCNVFGAGKLNLNSRIGLSDCAIHYDLARLTIDDDVISERRAPILTFGSGKVVLPPRSFLQATFAGEKILSNIVLEGVNGYNRIADLYCGLGPFSMRMAAHSLVSSFDSDEMSISALKKAVHNLQGQKPVITNVRDLGKNPLHKSELENFDAVVFDPPRAGAEPQAKELAMSKVSRVVAVSCNAATFARDASILIDGGYRLGKVVPVDQFRFSSHVEMVGIFERI